MMLECADKGNDDIVPLMWRGNTSFFTIPRDFDLRLKPDSGEVFHEKMKVTQDGAEFPKSEAKSNLYTGIDLSECLPVDCV